MTTAERRVKVIEKLLDDTINDQVAMEIGIELKTNLLMGMAGHPQAEEIQKGIKMEEAALRGQPKVIAILEKKLKEAQDAVLRGNA